MVYPSEADLALLRQYQQHHDEQAFAEIVRRYAGVVFGACHRILGDRTRSQDAAQETFFKLFQKPESVTRSLGGWLHRVATQLSIDMVRSDAARQSREKQYVQDFPREVMQITQWEELSPLIDETLAEMDEEHRNLVVRHFLQGVSQADLALEQLTSPATISRRIKAAVEELTSALKRKGAIASSAVLATLLGEAAAEAVPPTLMAELGKMAMVSGASPGPGVPLPPVPAPQHVYSHSAAGYAAGGNSTVMSQVITYGAMALTIVAAAAMVLLFVMMMNQNPAHGSMFGARPGADSGGPGAVDCP